MTKPAYIPVEVIQDFMLDVFQGLGVPEDEARICADVLIASDLRGIESHGVGRLKYYYDRIKAGVQFTTTEVEIVKETETTALVDGHRGRGPPGNLGAPVAGPGRGVRHAAGRPPGGHLPPGRYGRGRDRGDRRHKPCCESR